MYVWVNLNVNLLNKFFCKLIIILIGHFVSVPLKTVMRVIPLLCLREEKITLQHRKRQPKPKQPTTRLEIK
jgi:hypothetical protein